MARANKPAKQPARVAKPAAGRRYTLQVSVHSSTPPLPTEEIPTAYRVIQIRGDQTLEDLHQVIVRAFERQGEFSYEFQLGEQPLDPVGARYVLPGAYDISVETGNPATGRVTDTSIDALGLQSGDRFTCWSDTGDDWWHPIRVERITQGMPRGKYPKVTKSVGESPFRRAGQQPPAPLVLGKSEGADAACLVGELHLKRGEYAKAVEAFSRALENSPTVDAYEGRARAYRALARQDERTAQQLRLK
jgi:hypothetical protein